MYNDVLYNSLICCQFLQKRNNNQVCITSNISNITHSSILLRFFCILKDSVSLLLSQKVLQWTRESFESHLCSLTIWSYLKKRSRNYRWNKLWVMVEMKTCLIMNGTYDGMKFELKKLNYWVMVSKPQAFIVTLMRTKRDDVYSWVWL